VVHFKISDTGMGIPKGKQDHIFGAFAQADGSTTRRYGGTGLGLAICRQLVTLMGGRIWVESEPGEGSTFHLTAKFGLQREVETRPVSVTTDRLKGIRVLVVDDHPTNRRILTETLGEWRMEAEAAQEGQAALDLLRRRRGEGRPFALAILDVQMPGMDGFTLAERIRRDPDLAGTFLILLPSAGSRGDAARCREMGVEGYLTKPVASVDLLECILTVIGSPRGEERPALATRHSLRESRRRLRVLLADDNPVNRMVGIRLLEKRGHSVVAVEDGRAAVAALEREEYDVLLLDVQMPVMDGFEATARIRAKEAETGRHLPIIALTAHAMEGDRKRCLDAGMDDYASKPIKAEDLFMTIERLVPASGASNEPCGRPPAAPAGASSIDGEGLLSRSENDRELMREIAGLFIEHSPRMLRDLREGLWRRDAQAVERAAREIKGSLDTLAAAAAAEIAWRIEAMGREGDLGGAEETFSILEREVRRMRPELSALAQDGAS
jgi:CheY-like chemotaxis protein